MNAINFNQIGIDDNCENVTKKTNNNNSNSNQNNKIKTNM